MDEAKRLDVLAAHRPSALVDDAELARLTRFAAQLCEAPTALVSLVEETRQLFIAREGLEARETPRSHSFCQHAMLGQQVMEVADASADERFAGNPLVTGAPGIRFYAGAPLVSEEGQPLGALCVIAPEPRPQGLSAVQREGLEVLAEAVMRRLKEQRGRDTAERSLRESEERFEALNDAIPQMAWATRPDGKTDYFNRRWEEFTGVPAAEHHGEGWLEALHPDDRAAAAEAWAEAVAGGEAYEVEYRLRRHDGAYRWTLARGLPMRAEDGTVVRWIGTNTDIHERKVLEERSSLLSRELSHRIKNIFSVVSGLVGLEARSQPELKPLAAAIARRITALGRAHDYIRPQGAEEAPKTLRGLLGELFAAYEDEDQRRIAIRGDDFAIGPEAVTPLALLFHELATNSCKYGALAVSDGRVTLDVSEGETVRFEWREQGQADAPPPAGEGGGGFGAQLKQLAVERQLGGRIERERYCGGYRCTVEVPRARLAGKDRGPAAEA